MNMPEINVPFEIEKSRKPMPACGKLKARVAVITGAAAGIGRQTAIRFAEEGCRVVVCDIREEKLTEVVELCERAGSEALAVVCDVRKYDDLSRLVKAAVDRFGRIDVLVNNAFFSSVFGMDRLPAFQEYTTEWLNETWETGFLAPWHLMLLCYPYLKASGHGSVINVGSAAGPLRLAGYPAYCAIKEALRGLSGVAAREWGVDNIRVNTINPGAGGEKMLTMKDTEWYKRRLETAKKHKVIPRMGDAYEDVAPVMVFLACDDSKYVTGTVIGADGGNWIM
jgi:NAD(P)-dependent dehydrogenase (short-subunit alcohol dehydrogenase family)